MISLKLIKLSDLEFARKLRNSNRENFYDTKEISKQDMANWFHELNYWFYIIWLGNKRIGTIGIKGDELHNVLIDKKYRKHGYFRQALKTLTKKDYRLEVKSDNEEAIKAYKKIGFKVIGYIMKI